MFTLLVLFTLQRFMFVQVVEPKPLPPPPTWKLRSDGSEAYLFDGDKQLGGYRFSDKVYMPWNGKDYDKGCPCPVTPPDPPTSASVFFVEGQSGSCGAGGCGTTAGRRGLFGRRR
jgi:hypothetical protein